MPFSFAYILSMDLIPQSKDDKQIVFYCKVNTIIRNAIAFIISIRNIGVNERMIVFKYEAINATELVPSTS